MPYKDLLIVDDDPRMLRCLGAVLRGHVEVELAGSGAAALAAVAHTQFGLILCDLEMPLMTGLELARALERDRCTTPVAFMSGWGFDAIAQQVTGVAALCGILPKPWDPHTLIPTIRRWISS